MIDTTTSAPRRGALPIGEHAMTDAERSRRYRRRHSATRTLRLPADPADRLTAEADRLGVDPGDILAEALDARAHLLEYVPEVLEMVRRGGA